MTRENEIESLKTNEFLRRRKLRLQQVREQSKDIAKKIRQRARVEKLRHISELDASKEKEYLQQKEKLVKHLELLYAKGVKSVGTSHKSAVELKQASLDKIDLSKQRGREAVAELKRRKQEQLDEQKKLLDRKLQAREAANELSREKSSVVHKLLAKTSSNTVSEITNDKGARGDNKEVNNNAKDVKHSDMSTQWENDAVPNDEYDPNIPALSLPGVDRDSPKESFNNSETRLDKTKKLNLFAVSDEMPWSLRGGLADIPEETTIVKPSLTLVSEYIQHRGLRLRDTDTTSSHKRITSDLSKLKQTILKTRVSKPESGKNKNENKSASSSTLPSGSTRKNCVTMYNHSTRDIRDIPCGNNRLVVSNSRTDEDAYSQAMKESSSVDDTDRDHQKRLQDMRNKIAMTKQNVEKEYKDTMAFLGSLPKDKNSGYIKTAYMDERQQQMLKDSRQQKLQHEYRKIEKECRKHNHLRKATCDRSRNQNKSPSKTDGNFEARDFQYSWMPVPDSDGSFTVHTIPTATKESKTGNTVKFSKVDSYHEYRSRHKHTPPTKDTEKATQNKRIVEAVIVQNSDESSDNSSVSSSSSVEDLGTTTRRSRDEKKSEGLTDAQRIIIYKILDSKQKGKVKKNSKLIRDIVDSLSSFNKEHNNKLERENEKKENKEIKDPIKTTDKAEHIDEGVYQATNKNGDNITSLYLSDSRHTDEVILSGEKIRQWPCCCPKNLVEDQQHDAGTNLSHGGRRDDRSQDVKTTSSCTGKCNFADIGKGVRPTAMQPSAVASTSSFKTAGNDKTSMINSSNTALLDGGYIKVTDNDDQESGKFYIGASGFLKNDAYEVLIQLRKTDLSREDGKKHTNLTEEKILPSQELPQEQHKELPVCLDEFNNVQMAKENTHVIKLFDKPLESNKDKKNYDVTDRPIPDKTNNTDILQDSHMNKNNDENIHNSKESEQSTKYLDKGVCTSFQLSYGIPSQIPMSDQAPKSATSTYTQTTATPSHQRPVLIHMSSSTSTAYMSPPEMVLPKYLRLDSDEMYEDTLQRSNFQSDRIEIDECGHFKACMCKSHLPCSKNRSPRTKFPTPPNFARSYTAGEISDDHNNAHKVGKKKCYRCNNRTKTIKSCNKINNKKSTLIGPSKKRSCRNLISHVSSSAVSSSKSKKLDSKYKTNRKSNLNPIVKKYVDKLLLINKEGMKAIEVVNQECSAVTTPGSSIIEVPRNFGDQRSTVDQKISLQQIKTELITHILDDYTKKRQIVDHNRSNRVTKCQVSMPRIPKKRSLHKVKSLNISRRLLASKKKETKSLPKFDSTKINVMSSSSHHESGYTETLIPPKKVRSKSSPTPRQINELEFNRKNTVTDVTGTKSYSQVDAFQNRNAGLLNPKDCKTRSGLPENKDGNEILRTHSNRSGTTTERETSCKFDEFPINTSTQTSRDIDSEINYTKLAEDKIQNMEKIADLTEKCTRRLSSLAKVLEEVRRNKSLAYSQISTSDSASDSDYRLEINTNTNSVPVTDVQKILDTKSSTSIVTTEGEVNETVDSSKYIPFLTNIPKPELSKYPIKTISETTDDIAVGENQNVIKSKLRPPPALSRLNLKHRQGYVTPHELSTVVEVDSPMSVKVKTQSSYADTKGEVPDVSEHVPNGTNYDATIEPRESIHAGSGEEQHPNPDLLQSNYNLSKRRIQKSSTDSSDDSKLQMMDLKQFNDIMLQPFISIHEYAKQCNIRTLEGTNIEDIPKDEGNDDLSSMQSDGSLPDVIAELLKRKIITEPFKYDTASNVVSTSGSSESTLSVLALSKIRKDKRKASVMFEEKENVAETSDTLSFSSNPDLENAFKKLGMGWASSTLKKTKERLALSSSSNTSSSSMSQFKMKSFNNQDIPALVTDSVSAILNVSKKSVEGRCAAENSKNTGQQTSMTKAMTVKEFLTNELADKITFTNKSNRNGTEDEFVSLFETKMPEEMKHSSQVIREEHTADSGVTGNNRARTSTPVQMFKSMTYHSSSSSNSNVSNGLFSNADELSSVKVTSNSMRNHSTSDKDDLTIPNCSLRIKKDASKSD